MITSATRSLSWTSATRKDALSNSLDPAARFSDIETVRARAGLLPTDSASFAVTSRLLASIVTEGLLEAAYIPAHSTLCAGLCVVISSPKRNEEIFYVNDIFAVVPLHHAPILKSEMEPLLDERRVWLLDPYDMIPAFYFLQNGSMNEVSGFLSLRCSTDIMERNPMTWLPSFALLSPPDHLPYQPPLLQSKPSILCSGGPASPPLPPSPLSSRTAWAKKFTAPSYGSVYSPLILPSNSLTDTMPQNPHTQHPFLCHL